MKDEDYLTCAILALAFLGWRQHEIASELSTAQTWVSRVSIRYGIRRHTRHTVPPKHPRFPRFSLRSAPGNGIMTG